MTPPVREESETAAKDNRLIGWIQVAVTVISIFVGIGTTAVIVTRYIDSIERKQAILEARMDAFEKYGSSQAREAVSEVSNIATKQQGDMAVITEKINRLTDSFASVQADMKEVKADFKEHVRTQQKVN